MILSTSATYAAWATAVAALFSLLLLSVAALAAWRQLGSVDRGRYATILADLMRRWDEPALANARMKAGPFREKPYELCKEIIAHHGKSDQDYFLLIRLPNFFESLGLLAREHAIPLHLVDTALGGNIRRYWRLYEPYIQERRHRDRDVFENFRWLEKELRRIEEGPLEKRWWLRRLLTWAILGEHHHTHH